MQFEQIANHLSAHLPEPVFAGDLLSIDACPSTPGIYVVAIRIAKPLIIQRPKEIHLPAGLYAYAGSARGPGGIRARLARHLAPEKKQRWHIDQITTGFAKRFAWGWHEGSECDLIRILEQIEASHHPLARFGSSDCKQCLSHMLRCCD